MKKIFIIGTISYLFILLFLYTGIMKIIDYHHNQFILTQSPLIRHFATAIAICLPPAEIAVAVCMFLPRTQRIALYASLVLMSIFTLYVGYMLAFYAPYQRPCSCGGIISKMNWHQHLYFNLLFTFLAATAILLQKDKLLNKPSYVPSSNI